VENLAPTGIRSPDPPARSESLYRLSYPGPTTRRYPIKKSDCIKSKTETPKYKMYANRMHRIMVRRERQEMTKGGLESVLCLISWSLSPRHGASSGCGWRRRSPIWRAAVNILNKQSQTADKGRSFSLGVGRGANNFST